MLVERLPIDHLHHEIRLAVFCDAAVEQVGNVRVIQRRQNLPFGEEAVPGVGRREADGEELQGDPLVELSVGTMSQKDASHASVPQLVDQLVGADAPAFKGLRRRSPVKRRAQVVHRAVYRPLRFVRL